jgi:eukaryotic-like serine/threonine-protein kinase
VGARAEEFGPYIVYEQIGLGGMATVHRAETTGIAGFTKQVALKRMLPSVAANASLVKSFIREARLASHLRHANVAQTFDLGKVGETYFIAMELVPGRNLREILKHCAAVVGHMPLPIVMNIINQICDALDYAHDLCDETGQPLGIIHRDVSPSNIICSEGGVVKLIDFGIAKATAAAHGMNTQSGTIKGKFGYMAPEYLMGSIDARADLFALGVIAHELLSNRPLFQGKDDMDTLYRVKDMVVSPPSKFNPKVPKQIDAIVMTALERDPDQRWQKANALHTAVATESKRLGLLAQNAQVVEWIEWAFQQRKGQRIETEPEISISSGTAEVGEATKLLRPSATLRTQPAPERDGHDDPTGKFKAAPPQQVTLLEPGDDDNLRTVPPRTQRPSAPPGSHNASAFVISKDQSLEPLVPAPDATPALARTLPGQGSPAPVTPKMVVNAPSNPLVSGARTNVHMPRARPSEPPMIDDLSARGERPAARNLSVPAAPTMVKTRVEDRKRAGASPFLLALLVLGAAAAAAAVVYFALPYLT